MELRLIPAKTGNGTMKMCTNCKSYLSVDSWPPKRKDMQLLNSYELYVHPLWRSVIDYKFSYRYQGKIFDTDTWLIVPFLPACITACVLRLKLFFWYVFRKKLSSYRSAEGNVLYLKNLFSCWNIYFTHKAQSYSTRTFVQLQS